MPTNSPPIIAWSKANSQTPATTMTQANVPQTPTVDEAVNVILNNPDAIAKLKDALKDA